MKKTLAILVLWLSCLTVSWGQINTDRVLNIGRNALYFEDYVLSIQYFNEVIAVKPYLAEPYLYRSIAKIYLDDYLGASQDAGACIERNPFIVTSYHVRGIARQNLKDYMGAIEDFKKGLEYQPENRTFLRLLAISYAMNKNTEQADSCFNRLVEMFPNDPAGYLNRAQLSLEHDDSLSAFSDLNRAIELDKGSSVAYALRAMIHEQAARHDSALVDLNRAIRLDPEQPAFYINRGLIYYNQNNIRGAMKDYDQAIELDPRSQTALYNRGLMRAQIGDRNRAIEDFSAVLDLDPDNTFAAYNRAILRDETGDLRGAVEDYTAVFEQHPRFFPALYARAEDNKKLGRTKAADEDFKQAFLIEQQAKQAKERGETQPEDAELTDHERSRKESDKNIRKFNRVMTAQIDDTQDRYKSSIRGRIQDKQFTVDLQPMFILSYYEESSEVRQWIYFERTLSDFNRAGLLSRRLKVVCHEPMLSQSQVKAHFTSIDDYSRFIGTSGGNVITFFGRSLDYMLVQDYQNAIADLNQVILRRSDFILAYFNRAVIRFRQLEVNERSMTKASTLEGEEELKNSALGQHVEYQSVRGITASQQASIDMERMKATRKVECELAIRDLDRVIELSPSFVYAYYNRAFISSKLNNLDAAVEDLNRAIELYPNFAEAYYNRGLILLRQGKSKAGIQDLSKAGELGLVVAYSVLKRATAE